MGNGELFFFPGSPENGGGYVTNRGLGKMEEYISDDAEHARHFVPNPPIDEEKAFMHDVHGTDPAVTEVVAEAEHVQKLRDAGYEAAD